MPMDSTPEILSVILPPQSPQRISKSSATEFTTEVYTLFYSISKVFFVDSTHLLCRAKSAVKNMSVTARSREIAQIVSEKLRLIWLSVRYNMAAVSTFLFVVLIFKNGTYIYIYIFPFFILLLLIYIHIHARRYIYVYNHNIT